MAVQFAFGKIVTDGLALAVDAANPVSYPGGTTWRDVTPNNLNGTITGSIAYTSEFYGGLVFSGPTASIAFPTSSANFGTSSFTVEMTFKPSTISGRHTLASKNSGSFPTWNIYISGSNNTGKLWSEYRLSSTISCSVSSSTTLVTGSVYQIDVRLFPGASASGIYIDGNSEGGIRGNGGGSLTSTSSLFIGNTAPSSSVAFLGTVYSFKTYLQATTLQPVLNYNTTSTRYSKPQVPDTAKKRYEILIVAGGGAGGRAFGGGGGGGGAGGLQYINTLDILPGNLQVIVGNGATSTDSDGQNSVFSSFISFGGGGGGLNGKNGGSGGGAGRVTTTFNSGGLSLGSQGNPGGSVTGPTDNSYSSAGGGGAGTAGVSITGPSQRGNGGSGSFISAFAAIGGFPAGWFAGGGGGSMNAFGAFSGSGGIGGGGNGEYTTPQTGLANTGGGGGGGWQGHGNGGSGIVAIRYNGSPIAIGGEITQSAGYTYHVFRTVGTSSFILF